MMLERYLKKVEKEDYCDSISLRIFQEIFLYQNLLEIHNKRSPLLF